MTVLQKQLHEIRSLVKEVFEPQQIILLWEIALSNINKAHYIKSLLDDRTQQKPMSAKIFLDNFEYILDLLYYFKTKIGFQIFENDLFRESWVYGIIKLETKLLYWYEYLLRDW